MEKFGPVVHRIFGRKTRSYLLLVFVCPSVADGQKPASQKGVDDGTEENESRRQIEGLLTDTVREHVNDTRHALIAIAFQTGWKRRGALRRLRGTKNFGAGKTKHTCDNNQTQCQGPLHVYFFL